MNRAAITIIPLLLCLSSAASADPRSDARALHQAVIIRIAILETLLDPIQEPIRTANDIERLVYKPVNNAANDLLTQAAAMAGPENPYKAYTVCHQAALDFNLYVIEIVYALKMSKPLPAIASDRDYRSTLSACAAATGGL
jgi:hypothetical protein